MKYLVLFFTLCWFVSDSIAQEGRIWWFDLTTAEIVISQDRQYSWWEYNPTRLPDDNNVIIELWANVDKGTLHLYPRGRKVVGTLDGQVPHVSMLNEGEIIGPSSDWQATLLTDGSEQRDALLPLVSSAAYTVWHGKTGYAGVQILPENRVHYGWIKFRVSGDGQEMHVLGVAFHADPDQPIVAGDVGDTQSETAVTQTSSSLCFSITNAGNIGYVTTSTESGAFSCPPTEDESRGIGMYYKGRSLMHEGGLLLGVDASHVLSTVRGSSYLFIQDGDLSQRPGSIMRVLKDGDAQRGRVELVDTHAKNPIGLHIIQDSFSFSTVEDGDYVILHYKVANKSSADIENMFAGLWVDWNIGSDVTQNSMDFDENRNMGFARSDRESDPVAAIYVLNQAHSLVTSYAANVQIDLGSNAFANLLTREAKWNVLSGATQRKYISGVDVLQIAAVGPIQIAAGETVTIPFALVVGDNVEDLRINADRALAKYQGGIPISAERTAPIPDGITIGEVFPNPITNQATFPYKLSHNNAHVEVEVYDLLGRKLLHLLSARKQAGEHMLTWNTHQMSLPSGMYAVRWTVSYAARQHREIRFVAVY
ncbi:MAG: T9SS type A sorting domain-containing protein [Bacteroidetes bacterium]|nr:T9SS type A sorting domain-containing protein [Bacteroidota bacterium]